MNSELAVTHVSALSLTMPVDAAIRKAADLLEVSGAEVRQAWERHLERSAASLRQASVSG